MNDKETIKSLRRQLYFERESNRELAKQLNTAEFDLQKKNAWLAEKFNFFAKCAGENTRPTITYLLTETAKILGAKI